MEAPTGLHRLRGPSPIVWAMRTRVAPPPRLAEPISRPVYPPPPPPQAPLPERRRRGRPRKVACLPPPPGLGPPPGFAPSPAARPAPAATAHGYGELGGLQPHVLTIAAGEDIISRVMAVSQLNSKAICILSALGSVKEAVLVQPSGVTLTHKGPLEIIRLSGSILTSNDHRSLRITLASVNSLVISGIIAGPLIAETPVQTLKRRLSDKAPWQRLRQFFEAFTTVDSLRTTHLGQPLRVILICKHGSSEVDVKPFVGLLSPNPEYASCTRVERYESSEVDVKPFVGLVNPNPEYTPHTSMLQNESGEIDVKPFIGVVSPNPGHASLTSAEQNESSMGRTCVYVHHVDKDAFLKSNIDPDPDELDMVFDLCPSYAELLEQVRKDLNWMDPSDVVEFAGRHNVGFGMHIRWKTMRVNSEQRWLAYKDTVAESLDKALELFAMKTNVPNLLDLNRVSSSTVEAIPATINEEASIEPLSCVYEANKEVNIEHEPLVEANYEHYDDGNVLHDNNLGDLEKYNLQETMDHSIPYSRGYASESDDEGPDEEVDEEGFTAKEAEAFTKVLKRDHRTPLFEDLSLADEAVVDGGEGILFGVIIILNLILPASHP
ncbi:AT-hook motif nuclear-localized protein 9-like [Hordeum vulgare]|nr:AT-hook motif nuclear-localized protein 9-like [Hordeum vulgare]